jgi:hypothetical protein
METDISPLSEAQLNQTAGSVMPGNTQTLMLLLNGINLEENIYTRDLILEYNTPFTNAMKVSVTMKVKINKAPTLVRPFQPKFLELYQDTLLYSLTSYFSDEPGEDMIFSGLSDKDNVVTSITNSKLSITPAKTGTTSVVITATDRFGKSVKAALNLTISEKVNETNSLNLKVWPNPFTSSTTISYYLPNVSPSEVKILDAMGNVIATLKNPDQSPGLKQLQFFDSSLQAGVYFVRLITENSKSEVLKLIKY